LARNHEHLHNCSSIILFIN